MTPILSLIIPTRERSDYLGHAIRTCMQSSRHDFEILVLDNASTDNTYEVVREIKDERIRYDRNDARLSMRDNFEKGIDLSKGEIICFIGDDDGILPNAIDRAIDIFLRYDIDAVSAERVGYFWPDLLTRRKNTALLPRGRGISLLESRKELFKLLDDCDYYRLPCLYHGFVRRSLVNKVKQKQSRLFLSSQVDMFSAIALSMEGVSYAYSRMPFIINGASKRSNGAAHFGGGEAREKRLWKIEDDIGFLPGFDQSLSIGSLIVESALRYSQARSVPLGEILETRSVEATFNYECALRREADRPSCESELLKRSLGIALTVEPNGVTSSVRAVQRAARLVKKFLNSRPIDLANKHVNNVYEGAQYFDRMISSGRTGLLYCPLGQILTAFRIVR